MGRENDGGRNWTSGVLLFFEHTYYWREGFNVEGERARGKLMKAGIGGRGIDSWALCRRGREIFLTLRLVTGKDEEQSGETRCKGRISTKLTHCLALLSRMNTAVHDFEVLSSQVLWKLSHESQGRITVSSPTSGSSPHMTQHSCIQSGKHYLSFQISIQSMLLGPFQIISRMK